MNRPNRSASHLNLAAAFSAPAIRRHSASAAAARTVTRIEPLERRTLFSALALDAHFGNGGTATFDFSHSADSASGTYTLGDGKILVTGSGRFDHNNGGLLARFNADGTLDHTFGTGGFTVTYDTGGAAIAVDAAGDIYVAGGTWLAGNGTVASVTRFHADGSVDPSFGNGGIAVADFLTGSTGGAGFSAIALQHDGKIVAIGTSNHVGFHMSDMSDMVVARFNVDGSEDTTFGSDHGQLTLSFGTSTISNNDRAGALAIQDDGKIVIGGETSNNLSGTSFTQTFTVVRLNADGTSDYAFGDAGHVMTLFHDADTSWVHADRANVTGLLVQGDGKIVAVGMGNWGQLAAARYNADGSLDTTFADGGTFLRSALYHGNYRARAMSDGGFAVAGGEVDLGMSPSVYYGRFDGNGKNLDSTTFEGSAAPNQNFSNVAFEPDGSLLAAGATYALPPSGTDPNWDSTGDVLIAKFDLVGAMSADGGSLTGGANTGGGSSSTDVTGTGGTTTGTTTTGGGSTSGGIATGGTVAVGGAFSGPLLSVGGNLLKTYAIAVQSSPPHVIHVTGPSKAKAGKSYRFTVTYTSADNQPLTTSDQADISVTGPANWQGIAKVVKSRTSHHGKRRAVTYAVQLPAGTPAAGLYTINNGTGKIGVFRVGVGHQRAAR
ncbi:MAG: Delta-60 repeat-containing protein [Phycisphaerales bacterium]|nr:Delta-60 repeat-containing protein [Phycisphaerales bacterium]